MTIRMQEAEFFSNPAQVMRHVGNGDEVRIERDGQEIAVLHDPNQAVLPSIRPISEVIERLQQSEGAYGPAIMDREFAADVAEAHEFWNQPLDNSKWD